MINGRYIYEIFCCSCGRGILVDPKSLLTMKREEIKKILCAKCIKHEKQLPFDFAVRVR